jgi:RecJ-like exonuclease
MNSNFENEISDLGLIPGFFSYKKLFISQIKYDVKVKSTSSSSSSSSSSTSSATPTIYLFSIESKPLLKVHIVGIIVRIEKKAKRIIFVCDDGTSTISAIQFFDPNDELPYPDILPGDLVSIRGSLMKLESSNISYDFSVKIESLERLNDPNLELLHWAQILHNFSEHIENFT